MTDIILGKKLLKIRTYLAICMIFQTINPAIPNSITELFLLPVQYVLKEKGKKEHCKNYSMRIPQQLVEGKIKLAKLLSRNV